MPGGIGAATAARKPPPSTTVPSPALLRAGATWPGFALVLIANQVQYKYKTTALRGCPASAHGGARVIKVSARCRLVLTGGSGPLTGSHPLGCASSTQLLHNAAFCLVGHQSRAKRALCWPTPAASGLNKTGRYAKCLPWALRPAPALPGRGPCPALRSGSGRAAWLAKGQVSVSALRAVCQSAAFGRVMAVGPPPTRFSFASLTSSAPWPVRPPEGGSLQSAGVISISSLSGPQVSCPPRPAVAAGKGSVSGASPRPQLTLRRAQ